MSTTPPAAPAVVTPTDATPAVKITGDLYIQNVPRDLLRAVKTQAILRGMTLRGFVIQTLERVLPKSGAPAKAKKTAKGKAKK